MAKCLIESLLLLIPVLTIAETLAATKKLDYAMNYPKAYLYQRIVQAKLFIDENYEQDINIENIADEASFSKFHFIRLFKKAYGFTPRQYLISKRMEFAKNNLKENKTVSETCYGSGFSSLSTFSTLFKEFTGYTPTKFKEAYAIELESKKNTPQKYIPGCFIQKSNFQETTRTKSI